MIKFSFGRILPPLFFLPGVNFTNALRAEYLYKSFMCSLFVLTCKVSTFLSKNIGAKAARKMLVKLTTEDLCFRHESAHKAINNKICFPFKLSFENETGNKLNENFLK